MKDKNMYLRKKKAENLNNILICENCGEQQISVCDSRMLAGTRRRRRTCAVCGHKSTTYEISNEEFERLLNEGENQKAKYNHGYTKGHSDGYAKAIDEFAERLKERLKGMQMAELKGEDVCPCKETGEDCPYINQDIGCQYCAREQTIKDIDEIAEKLKGGATDEF